MTPREKVMTAIELEQSEVVPVVPQMTYANARIVGIAFQEAMNDAEKMAKALVAGYRMFGYDGIYVGWESSFNLVAEAMGCTLKPGGGGIPSVSGWVVSEAADVTRLANIDPERDGRLPVHLKAMELVREEVGDDVPLFRYVPGPFTLSSLLRGQSVFLGDLIKNQELVRAILRPATESVKRFAEATVEHEADIVVAADPMASTSVISPKMFEEFALPYLKEVMSVVRKAGSVPSLHVCGMTGPILRNLVETGTRIVELDHLVDLKKAKEAIGKDVCIQGNIDPVSILLRGKPEDVEKHALECISEAGQSGGFILSSGCEVPLETPLENIRAMVTASLNSRKRN
jgi:uroporphyrinogen decarboxylase